VIHERDDVRLPVMAICNCCWDCCGILKSYNMGAIALMYNASYVARLSDGNDCKGCGNCEKYCPTTAMRVKDKQVSFRADRCIGCGQCAFQCRQNHIEMVPGERSVYLPLLKQSEIRVVT
jgi:Pyruvate/2-oxoacid:ferredoxin oxidoreductase delta subunit